MSDTSTAKVRQKAIELLSVAPEGIRYMDLHRAIAESYPEIPINTVRGAFHKFRKNLPTDIQLVAKGFYRHVKFTQAQEAAQIFGIGLVLFDADNKQQPNFGIQVRAARNEPDYFYVNQNLKSVEDELFG